METLANRFSASRLATAIQIADCADTDASWLWQHECRTNPRLSRLIELEEPNRLPLRWSTQAIKDNEI